MRRIALTILAVVVGCVVCVRVADAEDKELRKITVTAAAETVIAPDFAVISTTVATLRKDVTAAQQANDKAVREAMSFLESMKVPGSKVRTGYVSLQPRWRERADREPVFEGYEALKQITVELHDLSNYDRLIQGILNAGVNRIDGVSFRSSIEVEKRRETRILAMRAARTKADYLAEQVGQKVGKPLEISEQTTAGWQDPYQTASNVQAIAVVPPEPDMRTGTIAPGSLTIRAAVTATFALIDP